MLFMRAFSLFAIDSFIERTCFLTLYDPVTRSSVRQSMPSGSVRRMKADDKSVSSGGRAHRGFPNRDKLPMRHRAGTPGMVKVPDLFRNSNGSRSVGSIISYSKSQGAYPVTRFK